MADSRTQGSPGGSGHQGAPEGAPPQSHEDMNRPGMTNGVPDDATAEEATGAPSSDRTRSETAGSPQQQDRQDQHGG